MSEELKSCPACGKPAEMEGPYTYDITILHELGCGDPRCVFFQLYNDHPFEDDMVAAWNSLPRREEFHAELVELARTAKAEGDELMLAEGYALIDFVSTIRKLARKYAPKPEAANEESNDKDEWKHVT